MIITIKRTIVILVKKDPDPKKIILNVINEVAPLFNSIKLLAVLNIPFTALS